MVPLENKIHAFNAHLVASGANYQDDLPLCSEGMYLDDIYLTSSTNFKLEILVNYAPILVVMNSRATPTLHANLGLAVPPHHQVKFKLTNLDQFASDAYVTFKYRERDLQREFDHQFHRDLEAKLDNV